MTRLAREANNARLHAGETQYTGMDDRLFVENAPLEDLTFVA